MSHSLAGKQDKLTAGTNISISGTTINCTYSAPTNYVKQDNGALAIGSFTIASPVKFNASGKVSLSVNSGDTYAGSSLREVQTSSSGSSASGTDIGSGTWRNIGKSTATYSHASNGASSWSGTLMQRIA